MFLPAVLCRRECRPARGIAAFAVAAVALDVDVVNGRAARRRDFV